MSADVAARPIRRILTPTALSLEYEGGFEHACLLAQRFRARLAVYHALVIPPGEYGYWATGQEDAVWARTEKAARDALSLRIESHKVECEIMLERGVPAPGVLGDGAILRAADRAEADLIVMGVRRGRSHCGVFCGGLTEKVVDGSHRPVLCIPTDGERTAEPYRRIVVPTDLSTLSREALPLAAVLAKAFDARVIGVHIVPRRALTSPAASPRTRATQEGLIAAFMRRGMPGLDVEGRVHETTAAISGGIVDAARAEEANLIVMSTAGHASARCWAGSNAEHVLRRASCPVLIVGPAHSAMLLRGAA